MRENLRRKNKGIALIMTLAILAAVIVAGTTYVDLSTQNVRLSHYRQREIVMLNLSDSAIQAEMLNLWKPFKVVQKFDTLDATLTGATPSVSKAIITTTMDGNNKYTAGVISYIVVDNFTRYVTIRGVGWVDTNGNGVLDNNEPRKVVDVTTMFALGRSQVFDYAYFVNNYGWMQGFGAADLIVNGDMRANGNFDFSGGSPTINGSVYAAANNKLDPPAAGIVNITPNQWDNNSYAAQNDPRARQAYDATKFGAKGSAQYEQWRDLLYDNQASIVNNRFAGSVVGDATGIKSYSGTVLDSTPTQEVAMPDLSDLSHYQALSATWTDPKQTFLDGSANPDYNKEAYVDLWDSGQNKYVRVTTAGQLNGSIALVGTSDHPVKIHGPVTFSQDCVIKGTIQGQGTIYTGRNVHIVGSIVYKNSPDFRGTNGAAMDMVNEKKDMLALAARGSVIMGDTSQFGGYPLDYMSPPFTHGRYDENGNYLPAFNAKDRDETGLMKYQSTLGDTAIHNISEGINQIDAVLYTNFVGGGNLATSGGGCVFNGTIISKDEAMVLWSLPMKMNYDNRIKERTINGSPLIDVNLPRAPNLTRMTWHNQGSWNY